MTSRQAGLGDPLDMALVPAAVADEVVDRDHRQAVLVRELPQLGRTLHRAVVVDDLDQHTRGGQPGQLGQVDGRLGVAAAHEHPALPVAQWEDVSGARQVPRLGRGVGQGACGVGAVGSADAGADAVARVDRDRVGGAQLVLVVRGHQRDLEPLEHVAGHRHADHAAGVADRERHQLGRGPGGGEDDVALVLTVLVIDDHDGLAGRDVGDGPLHRVEPDAHAGTSSRWGSPVSEVSTTVRLARHQTKNPMTTKTA